MKINPEQTLEEWVQTDQTLSDKLVELDQSGLTMEDQARDAFHFLCETYHLPKFPLDLEDRDWEEAGGDHWFLPISVFEQIAQLRFGEPESIDPRYLVLKSAYLVKNKLTIDLSTELEEYLNGDELQGLGYRGKDIDAELVPVRNGESWIDLGCTFFTQEIV